MKSVIITCILILIGVFILNIHFAIIGSDPEPSERLRLLAYSENKAHNVFDESRGLPQVQANTQLVSENTSRSLSGKKDSDSRDTPSTDKAKKTLIRAIIQPFWRFKIIGDSVKKHILAFINAGQGYQTRFRRLLVQNLSSPESELVGGMIFGGSNQLSPVFKSQIKVIGLSHVVSASGYNVSLILNSGWFICRRFCPPRIVALGVLLLLLSYLWVAGPTASLSRAALMGALSVWAPAYSHCQYRARWGLVLVAGIMIMVSPALLRNISFQLSVAASAGILFILPLFEQHGGWLTQLAGDDLISADSASALSVVQVENWRRKIWAELRQSWLICVAAQLMTAPLILFHFGEFSWLSLVANPLLLWLTPLITVSGLGLLVLEVITQVCFPVFFLAHATARITQLTSSMFVEGVQFLGQFTGGLSQGISVTRLQVGLWYCALFWFWWILSRRQRLAKLKQPTFFHTI